MPDGAPAQWRNVITNEVLSAGKALSVGDILLQFSSGVAHGRRKGVECANHLSVTAPVSSNHRWIGCDVPEDSAHIRAGLG